MRERRAPSWRLVPWLILPFSWALTLPLAWRALTTVPSTERLGRSHMIEIPTMRTFALQVGISALELAVLLLVLWPWRARLWLLRTWLAAFGLLLYFLATPPLGLTALSLVHRRWLAASVLLLLLASVVGTISALPRSRTPN